MKRETKEVIFKFDTLRKIIQLLSFIIFSAVIFNIGTLPLLFPVLWTWGLQQNAVGDAFTAIQLTLYNAVFPWLAIASFLIVGVLIGKAMCGWICPFGFTQDLLSFVKRKKLQVSLRTHESMVYVKYAILGITLFISLTFAAAKLGNSQTSYESALGIFVKAPFSVLSPSETLFASIPQMTLGLYKALLEQPFSDVLAGISNVPILFWVQLFIMGSVLVLVAYVPRSWCKYFCPHGAIMAVLNKFSFLGLRRDPAKCAKGGCRLCVEACPMRVPILDLPWEKFSHQECIYCLKCVDACKDKAIRLKYP